MNAAADPYVMPRWTTGGTDVICEGDTDKKSVRDRGEERQRKGEREGEEERCNEARLQG